MGEAARRARTILEDDEIEILSEHCYGPEMEFRCELFFEHMVCLGKLRGRYENDEWTAFNEIGTGTVRFDFDEKKYLKGAFRFVGIAPKRLKGMMKCFVLCDLGLYSMEYVCREARIVARFLESFETGVSTLVEDETWTVDRFLRFARIPAEKVEAIDDRIFRRRNADSYQRTMPSLLSLLCLADATENAMRNGTEEEQLKVFPVWFLTHVATVVPLRATEILLTPKECVSRRNGKAYMKIRRTLLKKRDRGVYYSVDKDYEVEEFEIPDVESTRIVERYQERTKGHDRRFLFDFDENSTPLGMLSLTAYNSMIRSFMEERVFGNPEYDFARKVSGADEFDLVTAGDVRPVALSNLYFQGVSVDACRRLAGHEHAETTARYWSNVGRTLEASAVMKVQRERGRNPMTEEEMRRAMGTAMEIEASFPGSDSCMSPRRRKDPSDLTDCLANGRLEDCWGCPHYRFSRAEVEARYEEDGRLVERDSKRLARFVAAASGKRKEELDKIVLDLRTAGSRYRRACEAKYEEEWRAWRKQEESRRTAMVV